MDGCDTYAVTQNIFQSPNGRLRIAEKIFNDQEISKDELTGIYTCTLCAACDLICPEAINITNIIHSSKIKLVEVGKDPLEIHKKIIQGIIENDNSVGGKPEDRLNWLPEKYRETETFEKKRD